MRMRILFTLALDPALLLSLQPSLALALDLYLSLSLARDLSPFLAPTHPAAVAAPPSTLF